MDFTSSAREVTMGISESLREKISYQRHLSSAVQHEVDGYYSGELKGKIYALVYLFRVSSID